MFLQQEPSMGIIMARNNIFKLEGYEGKYHVKTLAVGTVIKLRSDALKIRGRRQARTVRRPPCSRDRTIDAEPSLQ